MMKKAFGNMVGKAENACNESFLHFVNPASRELDKAVAFLWCMCIPVHPDQNL